MIGRHIKFSFITMLQLMSIALIGQDLDVSQSEESSVEDTISFIVFEADTADHISLDNIELDTLRGNVILSQDSLVMYCDLAILMERIDARAYHNVVIIHQDSIQIFADSLIYDGRSKIAELFGEVILQEGERRLYTDYLIYDVNQKTATYSTGGTLIEGVDTILSKSGFYEQREKQVTLFGNVWYRDTSRTLRTDSILYLYDREQLNLVEPTSISQDSIEIYCEGGIYRLKEDRGILSNNVQVKSDDQFITSGILDIKGDEGIYTFMIDPFLNDDNGQASGDTIRYYKNDGYLDIIKNAVYRSTTEVMRAPVIRYTESNDTYETRGRAIVDTDESYIESDSIKSVDDGSTLLKGNIILVDKKSDLTIRSDNAIKGENHLKVYNSKFGQPLLSYPMSTDTLRLVSDTLYNVEASEVDSIGAYLEATGNVSWMSGKTSSVSSSFIFDRQDSIITLYGSPVLWSDDTQLSADTIHLYIKNNDVHKIILLNNAFIVSPDQNENFNQIKGSLIENLMENQEIRSSDVQQNAELHYLILQDDEYKGISVSRSQSILLTFMDNEITKVNMEGQPESNMYEYVEGMDLTLYYLDGFLWRIAEKPEGSLFIFYATK